MAHSSSYLSILNSSLLLGVTEEEGFRISIARALGATDGHEENVSIFLSPGGRYHLTLLYDVISAQLNVDANRNRFRLAMEVGTNRRYQLNSIAPCHFIRLDRPEGGSRRGGS